MLILITGVILGLMLAGIIVGTSLAGHGTTRMAQPPISPSTLAASTPTTVSASTTSISATTTVSTTTPSITSTDQGPTVATCEAAVTGTYFPDQAQRIQLGGLSTVQRIGYACNDQEQLSEAMAAVGNGTVYDGDVIELAQDVCNDYPQAPLCING